MRSWRVGYGGRTKKGRGEASKRLDRGSMGSKAVKKFGLGINSGILLQECCPFLVVSLLLCIFSYLFIYIDHICPGSFYARTMFYDTLFSSHTEQTLQQSNNNNNNKNNSNK